MIVDKNGLTQDELEEITGLPATPEQEIKKELDEELREEAGI